MKTFDNRGWHYPILMAHARSGRARTVQMIDVEYVEIVNPTMFG